MPAAPGRLSITTGWPRRLASASEMEREARSEALPGGNGTTMRTGRLGYDCACAAQQSTRPASAAANLDFIYRFLLSRYFVITSRHVQADARWRSNSGG